MFQDEIKKEKNKNVTFEDIVGAEEYIDEFK